jgi:signal transduction histidine kinase
VGSLTKGIVDRILNPLNYINNFSQSSGSLLKEITEVTEKHQDTLSEDERDDLDSGFSMLKKNLEKIYEHGNSTTRIVKDMQKLLKGKSTEFFVTELNPFLESKARSAIQEVLNEYKDFSVKSTITLDTMPVKVSLLPFEFAQVITNLVSNACYALFERTKTDKVFAPEIIITTATVDGTICIRLRDNGMGIPKKETEQLFNPFFTTKPTSKGTGLGLYMSKDIIEYHKGRMSVSSKEGEFTEVEIILPVVS